MCERTAAKQKLEKVAAGMRAHADHFGNRQNVEQTGVNMMDMDFEAFKALIAEIMTQGYDRETAGRYAGLIGHTPMSDARGNIVLEY